VVAAPTKLVHVVATDGHRGAEVFAADLVRALADHGVQQTVAVLRSTGRSGPKYSAPVHALGPDGGRTLLGVGPRRVVRLRQLLRAEPGAVVQAHGGEAFKHAVAAAATLPGTKVVYRRIGTAPTSILTGARRAGHAALMRRAAAVVAVSDAVRDETLRVFGLAPERIVTIPNAVDPARLEPRTDRATARAALGLGDHAVVALSLGALSWEKDPLSALAVTTPLLRTDADLVHLFVGDGPLRGELERQVEREGLAGRVRLSGARGDVGDVLAAADLLLVASRSDGMEGMPATVIEAGFACLPVTAYGVAGVPEVVVDGATGLLCRPGDRAALTEAVAALAGDEGRRRRLGQAGAERCRERFAIAAVAPQYLRLYERLTSTASTAGPLAGAPAEAS
jgi:glycosyltransferase involved in cell wall biosynthesis